MRRPIVMHAAANSTVPPIVVPTWPHPGSPPEANPRRIVKIAHPMMSLIVSALTASRPRSLLSRSRSCSTFTVIGKALTVLTVAMNRAKTSRWLGTPRYRSGSSHAGTNAIAIGRTMSLMEIFRLSLRCRHTTETSTSRPALSSSKNSPTHATVSSMLICTASTGKSHP